MILTQYLFHVLIIQGFCRFQVSLCSFNSIPLRPQDPQVVLKVKEKEEIVTFHLHHFFFSKQLISLHPYICVCSNTMDFKNQKSSPHISL